MGAREFQITASGTTPQQAFTNAVKQCLYSHGHDGYTGTIAEKQSFSMASSTPLSESEAQTLIDETIDTTYTDKWGPAGCIQINTYNTEVNTYIFYGWAPS